MDRDAEHLRLLSIFHYIMGGISAFFSCFFLLYIIMGLVVVSSPSAFSGPNGQQGPPPALGWIMVVMGGIAIGFGWLIAGLYIHGGYCLARHKRPLYCLVTACISCLFMPFGTVLGVFTIIVLQRPGVREMFGEVEAPAP